MLTSANKRFSLPFTSQKTIPSEVEEAAVFAIAELERSRGGGLIARQPEEKLFFISKIGYPMWLFPKNEITYVFDGLSNSNYIVSYSDVPLAKVLMENLEANLRPREKYQLFLSDHGNYFQQPLKEKQFVFKGLIASLDFKNEFNIYRKEATETGLQINAVLLMPTLEEKTISAILSEFDNLQSILKDDADRLPECARLVNKTTSQYITEIEYEAAAVKDEADAKIKAQEELVNPQIAKLTKSYKNKMKILSESFDKELESLQRLKSKTLKNIESSEGKIRLYQREAETQATKKHDIYEKRWKQKIKETKKELDGLKKELKNIESSIKKISQQRMQQTSKLNFELDSEIKFARQPLIELETTRDAKMLAFKMEINKLLKQEKPVVEGLNKSLKLRETIKANFENLGIRNQGLKVPGLFYIPFYVVCYEMGLTRRYLILPPSMIATVDFSAKLKGVLGMTKIKNILSPRFKAITTIIENVQAITQQNSLFENQLNDLSQKNNLLNTSLFRENAAKGLVYLINEGWVSDKEHQALSNRLRV